MKNQKGITLVALVVTIIVLIILVGISINLALGDNGIITLAKRAKENTEFAKVEEEQQLNELYKELEAEGGNSSGGSNHTSVKKITLISQSMSSRYTNKIDVSSLVENYKSLTKDDFYLEIIWFGKLEHNESEYPHNPGNISDMLTYDANTGILTISYIIYDAATTSNMVGFKYNVYLKDETYNEKVILSKDLSSRYTNTIKVSNLVKNYKELTKEDFYLQITWLGNLEHNESEYPHNIGDISDMLTYDSDTGTLIISYIIYDQATTSNMLGFKYNLCLKVK